MATSALADNSAATSDWCALRPAQPGL